MQGFQRTIAATSVVGAAPAVAAPDPIRAALLAQFVGLLRAEAPSAASTDRVTDPAPGSRTRQLGFELVVRPSTVEGAERGLFLARGSVPCGAAVVIYPGRVHMALPALTHAAHLEMAADSDDDAALELRCSDKVIGLPDGSCLDGAVADAALLPMMTQYTIGHIANHAPTAAAVNCKLAGLNNYPSQLPADICGR